MNITKDGKWGKGWGEERTHAIVAVIGFLETCWPWDNDLLAKKAIRRDTNEVIGRVRHWRPRQSGMLLHAVRKRSKRLYSQCCSVWKWLSIERIRWISAMPSMISLTKTQLEGVFEELLWSYFGCQVLSLFSLKMTYYLKSSTKNQLSRYEIRVNPMKSHWDEASFGGPLKTSIASWSLYVADDPLCRFFTLYLFTLL